mgnify:CR=1 FL=1|jgi:cell division protein FtsX
MKKVKKEYPLEKLSEKLPNPKIFSILGLALILGVVIYLIILLLSLK